MTLGLYIGIVVITSIFWALAYVAAYRAKSTQKSLIIVGVATVVYSVALMVNLAILVTSDVL